MCSTVERFGDVPDAALGPEVVRVHAELESLNAQLLAAVAVFDGRGLCLSDGAASSSLWLQRHLRVSKHEADALVGCARAERDLPAVAQAHAEAKLGQGHVAQIARGIDRLGIEVLEQAAPLLLELAAVHPPRVLQTAIRRIEQVVDPEKADEEAKKRHRLRGLDLARTFDGYGYLSGLLTAETASMLAACLESLSLPREQPDGQPDLRSASERRHDAFAELLTMVVATADLPVSGGRNAHLDLLVDLPTLQAHSPEGEGTHNVLTGLLQTSLGPEAAHRLTCDCSARVIVTSAHDSVAQRSEIEASGDQPSDAPWSHYRSWGPAGSWHPGIGWIAAGRFNHRAQSDRRHAPHGHGVGLPLAVGRATRTVTPAQSAALHARDGGCIFPGCTRPPRWTHVHHVRHWSQGGPTDLDNLSNP